MFPGSSTQLEWHIWGKPKQILRLEVTGHHDKMLRGIEDKEFPSLESETVRASRVLRDRLASSSPVTVGRWRPREGERLPKVTQPVWAELGQNPGTGVGKVQGKSPILLDSLHSRGIKRIYPFGESTDITLSF